MTSPTVQAATALLRHIEGYLTFDPADMTAKFISSERRAEDQEPTLAAAWTCQHFLSRLTLQRPSLASPERALMVQLANTVHAHMEVYERMVGASCGDGGTGGGTSHRGAWMAWVVVWIYRAFATEAATDTSSWVQQEYQKRMQAARDLVDAHEKAGVSAVTYARLLCELHAAVQASEAEDGRDVLRDAQDAFLDFFRKEVFPGIARLYTGRPLGGDTGLSSIDDLFSFHPTSPGFAACAVTAACFDESDPHGGIACLVRQCRHHLLAHEAATRIPVGSDSASHASRVTQRLLEYQDALHHTLSLAQGAVQLLTTSVFSSSEVLRGSGDGEAEPRAGVWLVDGRRGSSHGWRVRTLLPPRVSLFLPGLCIAATVSLATDEMGTGTPSGDVQARVPTGNLLVAPTTLSLPHTGLVWIPGPMAAATGSAIVRSSDLVAVSALYLFTDLPPVPEECEREGDDASGMNLKGPSQTSAAWQVLERQVCQDTVHGLVVLLVQSTLSAAAQQRLQALTTATRTLVAVGSVGQWGLSQLALRFDSMPNTPATLALSLSSSSSSGGGLRGVRGGRGGVLLVPLDEASTTRQYTRAGDNRTLSFRETRRRLLVVVGEREVAEKSSSSVSPTATSQTMASSPMRPPSESSSSSGDSSCGSSDSSSSSVSRMDDEGEEAEWNHPCLGAPGPLPMVPHVRCSLVLGGATPSLQSAGVVVCGRVFEAVLHRRMLPPRLGEPLSVPTPQVELIVMAHLDSLLSSSSSSSAAQQGEAGRDVDTLRFQRRIAQAMRDALWAYLLVGQQRQSGGASVESAWSALQAALTETKDKDGPSYSGENDKPKREPNAPCVPIGYRETQLQVMAAYGGVARCLDELCRSAWVLQEEHRHDDSSTVVHPIFTPIIR